MTKQIFTAILLVFIFFSSNATTGGDAIIYPTVKQGKPINVFFYDLKGWPNSVNNLDVARQLFVDDDMNGIRIPIYGEPKRPAHPAPGEVNNLEYASLVATINRAKIGRGNKDFTIFASKKLEGENSFPAWVKDNNGVIPSKYAILLADYIEYMNSKNIEIDYLGVDNEYVYNEGKITPAKHKEIVDSLRVLATERNFKMPLIVGYEDYGPGKNNWMRLMYQNKWLNRMDVYGTHYYPKWRPKSKLKTDLAYAGNMPFWSTEPHWDKEDGATQITIAEKAMCAFWDQIDLGMSGFMWWAYRDLDSKRGQLMQATSTPMPGAQKIDIDDIDGRDITKYNKLQTRAFIEDSLVTVFAINNTANALSGYGFKLNKFFIDGDVEFRMWSNQSTNSGFKGKISDVTANKFTVNLQANTIWRFTFKIKELNTSSKNVSAGAFKVYPSVAQNSVTINNFNPQYTYTLFNVAGQKIRQVNTQRFNVSALANGTYLLLNQNGHSATFIKR